MIRNEENPSKCLISACKALITLLYGTIECLDKNTAGDGEIKVFLIKYKKY